MNKCPVGTTYYYVCLLEIHLHHICLSCGHSKFWLTSSSGYSYYVQVLAQDVHVNGCTCLNFCAVGLIGHSLSLKIDHGLAGESQLLILHPAFRNNLKGEQFKSNACQHAINMIVYIAGTLVI